MRVLKPNLKPTNHRIQSDCGICALSTITGESWETVHAARLQYFRSIGRVRGGTPVWWMKDYLAKHPRTLIIGHKQWGSRGHKWKYWLESEWWKFTSALDGIVLLVHTDHHCFVVDKTHWYDHGLKRPWGEALFHKKIHTVEIILLLESPNGIQDTTTAAANASGVAQPCPPVVS